MMQLKPAILDLITDDTIICRCENVSVAQILNAIGAEYDFTVRGVKVHTRAGMGPCQGRMCASVISRLIARKRGVPLEKVQMDTPRVPIKPIPLGALAEAK
jgi:NAD(P)H-nitrite reductase large subunit